MMALGLLGYISAALLLQLAVSIAVAARNYRRNPAYSASPSPEESPDILSSAWQGLRENWVKKEEALSISLWA